MHAMHIFTRAFTLLAVGAFAAACGGTKPPDAKTPAPAPSSAAALIDGTKAAGPTESAPTSSAAVYIDPEIQKLCSISVPEAFFPFDSAKVQPDAAKLLDAVVSCFTTGPLKGKSLKLVGRADPRGEAEYNLALGQSRADSVGGYLVTRGLDGSHKSTTSRGAMDATGTDEPTWAKDRRVDLMLAK